MRADQKRGGRGGSETLFRFPCNNNRAAGGMGLKLATHIVAGLGKNPIEYGGYMAKTEEGITIGGVSILILSRSPMK